ncbi:hypothetical protein [Mycobacterium sp. ITM-2016-00318]|uniref:hypothetical protein n=1 Tax=Mycobacterium sp. ITM-2016-00318 TaxID=2099693 RepID=UPI000CF97B88|nr:hypothetical protein [Mycobacterium sp. ITM-2016-00318]WNG93591.1 hypothetical protein C6A82_003710 [Mycobacterium sp. ITM-2016-00318]
MTRFLEAGGSEMDDVFIVTSEGSGCGHIARIVFAFDEVDARQTIQDSYPGELVVDVVAR